MYLDLDGRARLKGETFLKHESRSGLRVTRVGRAGQKECSMHWGLEPTDIMYKLHD